MNFEIVDFYLVRFSSPGDLVFWADIIIRNSLKFSMDIPGKMASCFFSSLVSGVVYNLMDSLGLKKQCSIGDGGARMIG